jgi:hypothetical protein
MDPQDPQVLYALVKGKVYRTMNGGGSWEIIFDQLSYAPGFWNTNKHLLDIEFKPNDPNTIYISSNGIGPTEFDNLLTAEVWVTHNAKAPVNDIIWSRIVNGIDSFTDRIGIETDPLNPDILYILYTIGMPNDQAKTILKKANFPNYQAQLVFEKTWGMGYSQHFGGTGYWCMNLEVSPVDPEIIYIGGWNLQTLNMNTGTYEFFGVSSAPHETFHVDQRIFKTVRSGDSAFLFCGNDGGVSRYDCKNKTMSSLNGTGLDNHQFYGIGYSPVIPDFYIGGTQDNHVIGNGDNTWNIGQVGDGYEVIIDPFEPNIVYCTSNGWSKSVNRSTNSGKNFSSINNNIPDQIRKDKGLNDRPLKLSPFDRNTLFVAYDEIYKTTNGGGNWQKITDFQTTSQVSDAIAAIGLTKSSESTMYVGYSGPTWGGYLTSSRLFVTHNSGQTWDDITDGIKNVVRWTTITDIHVSPENKNHVWVSFGNYWENNGNAVNRIWFSDDGGQNWIDISFNLPNLPVNCLNGFNFNLRHRILLGNDIGIFMFDEFSNTWEIISTGIPNALIYDIEVNHEGRKILAATYGRGIWVTDIPCDHDQEVYEIQGDKTYYGDHVITGNLQIKAGSNVNILGKLMLASNVKMIVEPGALLNIDGGTLTSLCNLPWQGIEVWGNSQAHQWPDAQGNYAQGFLELNDAVIENAIVAVSLWQPGEYSTTGGIVVANNSVFMNNRTSVHAPEYRNYHPVNEGEMDYRANFTRCKFEVDEDYPAAETFYKHVDLSRVKGVKFLACDFLLSPTAPNVSAYNMGIGSYSAGFSVNGVCTDQYLPCQHYDHSTFTGFNWAINAHNSDNSNRTFYVNLTQFNGNAYGIYTSGINNFSVFNSDFFIGYNDPESDPCDSDGKSASGFGIHMTGCTGFAIEENYFTKAIGAEEGNYTGILCKDSETEHDIIYLNIFDGLSYGNFAEGNNRSEDDDLKGLEFQCNTNTGNNIDFIVTGGDRPQIRGFQGSLSKEAGNTFSTGVQLPDGHFKITGRQVINYFYQTNPPIHYTENYVVPIYVSGANSCSPNSGGSSSTRDAVLSDDEKQEAELNYATNLADFNNVKALFDNLKDGGNTQGLKTEVETAWPSDMWALRAELLGKSPHLSKEVLMAASDKTDVLPEDILFEILSSNPDELRKEELISYLENKDQPLPAYMISILKQLAGGITYKTILQQDMTRYNAGKTQAAYALIRSCLNDTLSDYTYLRSWLDNLNNLNADMQIVAAYLSEENYAAAQAMLNLIPATRGLEGNALVEYNDYKSMMQMQIAWQQQGRTIFELNSTEVDILTGLVENTSGKAALMAKGILEYAYGHHYCNCLPVDDPAAWKSSVSLPGSEADNGLFIQAIPNPASTWVSFDFMLPVHINEAVLQITDVHGIGITAFVLTAKQGKQVWDIRDVKKGVYLYTLKAGAMSKNGKLIIQ